MGALAGKQRLKIAAYRAATLGSRFTRRAEPDLRILMWHKVNDISQNPLTVTPSMFREQLRALSAHYRVIDPSDLARCIEHGAALPPGAVLLTFDDGYRDNSVEAAPILRDLGLRAILFVAADLLGADSRLPHDRHLNHADPTLTWDELTAVQDVFEVGSHARTHRVLTRIPYDEAATEIRSSKTEIESRLGRPVRWFSYPKGSWGDYDDALELEVRRAGYLASFVTRPGGNSLRQVSGGTHLRRYNAEPLPTPLFLRMVAGDCDLIGVKDTSLGKRGKRLLNALLRTTVPSA
jgi:peptidoglycan/xylan/chitin deacetylase (PgdA/CDA1 family)